MGEVFLAEHKQLERRVALKVLRKELSNSPEVVRRFVDEARLVNQIKNEHIVEIHDFGEGPDGLQYFVMEFLLGRDLAQAREMDGPFGLNRSLDIVPQVGSALIAVHERKIIHRDLKPENIYLAEKGGRKDFVKLLDFDLAKLTEGTGCSGTAPPSGTLLGTPLYMSPEQAMGLRVDWRTDIFSLGLVLLWMLLTRFRMNPGLPRRFVGAAPSNPCPPSNRTSLREPVPPAVSGVLAGCLERDPAKRTQSMQEILEACRCRRRPGRHESRARPASPASGAGAPGGALEARELGAGPRAWNSGRAAPRVGHRAPKRAVLPPHRCCGRGGAGVALFGVVSGWCFAPRRRRRSSRHRSHGSPARRWRGCSPVLHQVPTVPAAAAPPVAVAPPIAPPPAAPQPRRPARPWGSPARTPAQKVPAASTPRSRRSHVGVESPRHGGAAVANGPGRKTRQAPQKTAEDRTAASSIPFSSSPCPKPARHQTLRPSRGGVLPPATMPEDPLALDGEARLRQLAEDVLAFLEGRRPTRTC